MTYPLYIFTGKIRLRRSENLLKHMVHSGKMNQPRSGVSQLRHTELYGRIRLLRRNVSLLKLTEPSGKTHQPRLGGNQPRHTDRFGKMSLLKLHVN
jgi:hypothetical protein